MPKANEYKFLIRLLFSFFCSAILKATKITLIALTIFIIYRFATVISEIGKPESDNIYISLYIQTASAIAPIITIVLALYYWRIQENRKNQYQLGQSIQKITSNALHSITFLSNRYTYTIMTMERIQDLQNLEDKIINYEEWQIDNVEQKTHNIHLEKCFIEFKSILMQNLNEIISSRSLILMLRIEELLQEATYKSRNAYMPNFKCNETTVNWFINFYKDINIEEILTFFNDIKVEIPFKSGKISSHFMRHFKIITIYDLVTSMKYIRHYKTIYEIESTGRTSNINKTLEDLKKIFN